MVVNTISMTHSLVVLDRVLRAALMREARSLLGSAASVMQEHKTGRVEDQRLGSPSDEWMSLVQRQTEVTFLGLKGSGSAS